MSQKILIVDDDPVVLRFIESILSKKKYEVETAVDGLDALVKIKSWEPDLVVLDIKMPEINGYDVCYQLRFNDEFEKIPIVLISAREKELGEEMSNRVNIEHLLKPLDVDKLLQTVGNLLQS